MGDKQSEHAIVSKKVGNSYPGDPLERRACQTIELQKGNMKDISRSDNVSTRQLQIAELSRTKLQGGLTSLNKHIDFEWMREAWRRTRKNGATGIDRMSTEDFEVELGTNLAILLDDVKSGRYSAPPVRRVEIPVRHEACICQRELTPPGKWRPTTPVYRFGSMEVTRWSKRNH